MENLEQYGSLGAAVLVIFYILKLNNERDIRDNERKKSEDARQADAYNTIKQSIDSRTEQLGEFMGYLKTRDENMGKILSELKADIKECKERIRKNTS